MGKQTSDLKIIRTFDFTLIMVQFFFFFPFA